MKEENKTQRKPLVSYINSNKQLLKGQQKEMDNEIVSKQKEAQ
jgi:hypothetical protein